MKLGQQVLRHSVPVQSVTLWWLGQAGVVIKSPGGRIAGIDPYLSNSCKALGEEHGFDMDRLVPPPLEPADMVGFDVYAMTHSHQDHLDPETLAGYLVRVEGGPGIYVTGDTAYHEILAIAAGPHRPDILLAVINPAFRNMGPAEAARLAKQLDVKLAIPCHYDLFPDNSLPPQLFRTNLKVEGIGERYRQLRHGEPLAFPG